LRDASNPLDIHRWSDLPVPELGPVEPVLWSEVGAGLDGLMLAAILIRAVSPLHSSFSRFELEVAQRLYGYRRDVVLVEVSERLRHFMHDQRQALPSAGYRPSVTRGRRSC
jgi:hypothetical protein